MMTVKRLPPALCALVACLIFVPATWAAPRRYAGGFRRGFELNAYFTFDNFGTKTALDDDFGGGFRFGYLYNPQQEIEFLVNGVSTTGTVDDGFGNLLLANDDITHFQTAYVFNFTTHDVVPYVTAGIGFIHTDDSLLGTETDATLGLGAGIRFFLGRVAYARFEARQNFFSGNLPVYQDGEGFTFQEMSFGIGWRFPTP